jgi:transposase
VELLRRYSKLPILRISARIARSERREAVEPVQSRRISHRLSAATVSQLCDEYRLGVATRTLAARYGVGKTVVTKLLREHGVPLRHQGLSDQQVRKAAALYTAGKSVAQVAQTLDLSPSSVYDALKRAGLSMRRAHEPGRRTGPVRKSGHE